MAAIPSNPTAASALDATRLDAASTPTALLVAAVAALVATGSLGPDGALPIWLQLTTLGALAIVDLRTLAARFGLLQEPRATSDLTAGLLALVTVHAALRFCGPLAADLHPLSYVLVAWLAAANAPRTGTRLLAAAIALEALPFLLGHPLGIAPGDTARVALRLAFIATFALLYVGFHRSSLVRSRQAAALAHHQKQRRDAARAHELRLLAADATPSLTGADDADDDGQQDARRAQLLTSAIDACERNTRRTLALLRDAIDARTVALLAVRSDEQTLELRDAVSALDRRLATDPVPLGAGVLGCVARERRPLRLNNVRRPLPYYIPSALPQTGTFLAVPLLEGARLVGILCVDREREAPFTRHQESLVAAAAAQVVRSIENERLFLQMERARHELQCVFDASRALSSALDLQSVLATSLRTLRQVTPYDAAAITLFDADRREHTVALVAGRGFERLLGRTYGDNKGLVAQAVRMRHYLPAGGEHRGERALIFDREARLRGIESLIVLPLIVRDRAIGTLVLAQAESGVFGDAQHRQMLEVVANQVAVAVANAQAYSRMEQLATTDGLTGLLNRRTFLERYETALARSARSGRPASVILTDIDFFKKFNDTYGHLTGDEVLRQVARTFAATLRCTDVVGRYGGEEFVILLEDTDTEGALRMAERLRQAVADLRVESAQGPLCVTVSLGVATRGVDADEGEALLELADKALYACKEAGRNCARAWSQLPRG